MSLTVDVKDVAWDLDTILAGRTLDALLDEADALAAKLAEARGTIGAMDATALTAFMKAMAEMEDTLGRAASFASLRFSTDTSDAERGALMQKVQERSTGIETQLLFFELEWAAVDDAQADVLLADERLAFCRHHLASVRRYRDHLLSDFDEKILTEKSVTGRGAWVRLFSELTSAITVELDGETVPLESGLSRL
ncbi:MAG: oligoendopeptidase, partial [Actinobacteria bacterium]|nr:oligoendopeptidase [Actinomycetota bacterium]